jgi:hypothetical protein
MKVIKVKRRREFKCPVHYFNLHNELVERNKNYKKPSGSYWRCKFMDGS